MLIDVLSDTHFDSHFSHIKPSDEAIMGLWYKLKPKGEMLVIAGDIGHYNDQNINILQSLRRNFYKNIVLVTGNHDYFVFPNRVTYMTGLDGRVKSVQHDSALTSRQRVDEFKAMCSEVDGLHLLDGNVAEIDGVKFGGAMGWYDGQYHKLYKKFIRTQGFDKRVRTQQLFQDSMPDWDYISPKIKYNEYFPLENAKIEKVLWNTPDVMVTHICPSTELSHQNPAHYMDADTTFFCYDGRNHMANFNGKYWIFGHSHFNAEYDIDSRFKLISNHLGYYKEAKQSRIKTIEV